MNSNKSGFTLIELLIIVAIIATLSGFALFTWAASARDKAAVNAYKTTMNNLTTAIENCLGTGGLLLDVNGEPGDQLCLGDSEANFPTLSDRCNPESPIFEIDVSGGRYGWRLTTSDSLGGDWDCRGCRLECQVEGCAEIGDCN